MKRKIIIAGNWKLNFTQQETENFLGELKNKINFTPKEFLQIIVHPSFTSLLTAKNLLKDFPSIKFGAQNCSQYENGAYTGEISVNMLKELGVETIIIGHSERREIFSEKDEEINAKLKTILKHNLRAIVCCGESEKTRDQGQTDTWITSQIQAAFADIEINENNFDRVTIAYEPIWAIGTGKTCQTEEANRVIKLIRSIVAKLYGVKIADKISILYGGSVKASNIEELLNTSDIDGALIGGASIKVEEFWQIINIGNKCDKITI